MLHKRFVSVLGLALLVVVLTGALAFAAITNVQITFTNPTQQDDGWVAIWDVTLDNLGTNVCIDVNGDGPTRCLGSGNGVYRCGRTGLSSGTTYNWTITEVQGLCSAVVDTETGSFLISPLAVSLAGFQGQMVDGQAVLSWETVSEADNAGFNILRGASENGPWVKVTDSLIAAQAPGSSQGRAYSWTDTAAQRGTTNWYMLEDVALNGTATQHGPVRVGFDGPNAVNIQAFSAQVDFWAWLKALFGR